MKRLSTLATLLALFLLALPLPAQKAKVDSLVLPPTFSDEMVLQRGRPLRLAGMAPAGTAVEVTLLTTPADGSRGTTVAQGKATAGKDARFAAELPALEAGGPYRLAFRSPRGERILENVYVGEVWLCSGQSNMELRLAECSTADRDVKAAAQATRLHLYNIESAFPLYADVWDEARIDSVDHGRYVRTARWTRSTPETAARFSAIAYHFGRILADSLRCHVGLICNAVGGATTEGWTDRHTLSIQVPEVLAGDWTENHNIMAWARNRARHNLSATNPKRHRHPFEPAYLFDYGIRPLTDYAVKGVIWYQGESNADLVKTHEKLFPALEHSWRTAFDNPDLPFFFVQLSSLSTRPQWPAFRDSQRRLADSLRLTYMVVSADVGDSLDVHPRNKLVVGRRLAASALHHAYGFADIVPNGPRPLSARSERAGEVRIRFADAEGLRLVGRPDPSHFEVASRSDLFVPAQEVRVEGNEVVLFCPRAARPTQVRFAWKPFTRALLFNRGNMPCSTFELPVKMAH